MGKLVKTLIAIVVGIFLIPALLVGGMMLFGTVLGFMASPKVMMVVLLILAIISLPGILIGWKVRSIRKGE